MITKKKIIIASLIVVVTVVLWWAKYYFIDQSVVSFKVTGDISLNVYHEGDTTKVATLFGDSELRLSHGNYSVVPLDDNYSKEGISFTSPSSSVITINPDYSTEKLAKLAIDAKSSIQTLFMQKYPSLMLDYSINSFTLYKRGEWGGGLLVRNDSTQNDTRDIYRFIVHYDKDWSIVSYPDLIVTQSIYKDTPTDVLYAVDTLDYSPPN